MPPAQMSLCLSIYQPPHHTSHMGFLKHRKNIENRRFCYTVHPFSTYHGTPHSHKSLHGFFRFSLRCIAVESYDIRVSRQEIVQFLVTVPHTRRDRLLRINLPCPCKNLAQHGQLLSGIVVLVGSLYKSHTKIRSSSLKRVITSFTYFSNLPCVRSSTTIE